MELGQVAYESYKGASGGRSLATGDNLPDWRQLSPEIRAAWRASADGVQMFLSADMKPEAPRTA